MEKRCSNGEQSGPGRQRPVLVGAVHGPGRSGQAIEMEGVSRDTHGGGGEVRRGIVWGGDHLTVEANDRDKTEAFSANLRSVDFSTWNGSKPVPTWAPALSFFGDYLIPWLCTPSQGLVVWAEGLEAGRYSPGALRFESAQVFWCMVRAFIAWVNLGMLPATRQTTPFACGELCPC